MNGQTFRYPLWAKGDLDGFFGLMVDNLVQVLVIVELCKRFAGLPDELIYGRILPGVAVSLLVGNVFYGMQARRAARRDGNASCTALPYGINTPSVIAFTLFIMAPVYARTNDAHLAWKAGLLACLVSGVIEFAGAFVAERLRRVTPRAALLGVLAAVGITFIAADFAFRIFASPLVAIPPLAILLLAYFARFQFPLGLPGGFIAVVVGSLVAWVGTVFDLAGLGVTQMAPDSVGHSLSAVGWSPPVFCGAEIAAVVGRPELLVGFLTVSVPMGLLNVIGSLQNIESAEAGGDRFATAPSLAVNGIGSMTAALFGSCFPTTIYIGHPGWKALGARSGYSILNGVFYTVLFLFGMGPLLAALVPIDAGAAIVMYIGIIITAQAFQATPRDHAPAVALSLFPALAAMLFFKSADLLRNGSAPRTMAELLSDPPPDISYLPGLLTLTGANSSWILVTLVLTAIAAALIERHYVAAAIWSTSAAALTAVGLMHAYRLEGNVLRELFIWQTLEHGPQTHGDRALPIAVAYAIAAALFGCAAFGSRRSSPPIEPAATRTGEHPADF